MGGMFGHTSSFKLGEYSRPKGVGEFKDSLKVLDKRIIDQFHKAIRFQLDNHLESAKEAYLLLFRFPSLRKNNVILYNLELIEKLKKDRKHV